ncbi:DUF362 domain-containing protein [Candidatus Amarolinea aalborgensis]|jgi:uncharacterized protein (DUF362 family)|uniref:DUF362 domain-containing protein n=1 Tax=Candidatus Amarolinea aalborgensis TaxID=2249329 RepID=UPI003BF9E34D
MMNRRQFCQKVFWFGGVLALAPFIEGCAEPASAPPADTPLPTATSRAAVGPTAAAPTATATNPPTAISQSTPGATASPTVTPDSSLATVALVSTTDRVMGVRRAIELLGVHAIGGRHVLLKPNFNSAAATPGSTHDDVLRTLLASLRDLGARSITLADRSGMGATRRVMEQKGIFALTKTFGATVVVLDELPADAWEISNGNDTHWKRGFPVPKLLLDAECVVQTCNLKTHRYGGDFTLSLKNSVGFVAKSHGAYNYMNELHGTDDQRRMIAEINTAYQPALVVLDGVEAFVKGGPDTGTRAATGVILAGVDRVALDAAGVAILRLFGTTPEVSHGHVFEQEQIARAVELGLGVDSPSKIRFATGDEASQAYAARIEAVLGA